MTAPKPHACATCVRAELSGSTRLDAVVHANRGRMARVARDEGLRGEDVFEAVQEAFGAWLARQGPGGSVHEVASTSPEQDGRTLVAFTRNIARNRRRLHAHARPHVGDVDTLAAPQAAADDQLLAAEEHARLDCCMGRLADVQRAVVTLRMLDELPGSDVARQLGVTPGHVAVLLHRAKSALATCLSEEA